ncbi:MAG: hypothetical protein ACT4OP_03840 [Actinomycetota bacterium]
MDSSTALTYPFLPALGMMWRGMSWTPVVVAAVLATASDNAEEAPEPAA